MRKYILLELKSKKENKEKGMASILYIMLIVLILGMLGVGFDGALGTYTANSLKNAADTATMAASAETTYNGNKRVIVKDKAYNKFLSLYSGYRKAYPNVTAKGNPKISLKVTKSRGSSVNNTLTVEIKEKSKTQFLGVAGINEFKYNIKSTARLGAQYEVK